MPGWYVRRGEKVVGPIDVGKLKELVSSGKLLPTDLLAEDVAGPWKKAADTTLYAKNSTTEITTELRPTTLVAKSDESPVLPQFAEHKPPTAAKVSGVIISAFGRGTLAVVRTLSQVLARRSQRKHELNLAKIQAQALANSQRSSGLSETAARTSSAPAPTPITFAPQIVQTTIVKAVSRGGGGCGCSGCGAILLLILLVFFALAVLSSPQEDSTTDAAIQGIDANAHRSQLASDLPEEPNKTEPTDQQQTGAIDDTRFRTWTSASGKYQTEARIISYANGVVTIENREGKRTKVEIGKLSESDRQFIDEWKRTR
jgi:hypothetical protein